MATKSLTFDIFGRDRSASKTMRKVGKEADRTGDMFRRAGTVAAAGLAVAAAAAVQFGVDSVKAYAEAQDAQNKLEFAYQKFPALAGGNIEALRKLNTELMKKTRFDDDALAVGQATLAQYGLTQTQLEQMTPLLADYAARSGKDIPTAAEDLGKALLGQGRALKDVGIDFTDTGTLAGNFDSIMGSLRAQVGGFAEQDAQTAAGKLENLQNRFGEVQESVGEKLMPVLEDAMDWMSTDGVQAVEDLTGVLGDLKDALKDLEEQEWFKGLNEALGEGGSLDLVGGGFFEHMNEYFLENSPMVQELGRRGVGGRGAGGGFAVALADMQNQLRTFRAGQNAEWDGIWTDTNGRAISGMGLVGGSFGSGLGGISGQTGLFEGDWLSQWIQIMTGASSETTTGWGNVDGQTLAGINQAGATLRTFRGIVGSEFQDSGRWLQAAGENIVEGLVGGIASMVGTAAREAANLAAQVVDSAKDALGIRSPSRVFRDEVGAQITAGLVQGLTAGTPSVAAAIDGMLEGPSMGVGVDVGRPFAPESAPRQVSLAGARIVIEVDGRQMNGYVREQASVVVEENQSRGYRLVRAGRS